MKQQPLILVYYINVNGVSRQKINQILKDVSENIANQTSEYSDSFLNLIVPVTQHESKIECLNPIFISEEKFEQISEKIEELSEQLLNNF